MPPPLTHPARSRPTDHDPAGATGAPPPAPLQIAYSWRQAGDKQYVINYLDTAGQQHTKMLDTDRRREDRWLEDAINWAYRLGREHGEHGRHG